MKKTLYTLIAMLGFANVSLAQTQINNITNFSDFNKSTTSSQVSNISTPYIGFNFSSSVTTADTGIMNKTFNTNTNNCTKISIHLDMNLGFGKGLDVIVNGGNNSTTAWTDTYRTAGNYPAPNTDWEYNRDFYTNIVEMKLKFSTSANSAGNSIVKNLIVTGYPTGCAITCIDTIISQPSNFSGLKGSNKTLSIAHSGTGNNYQWQSNPIGFGWQNVPNANQFEGANTNSLSVSNLTVSNHNQFFRVITSNSGCADTSNIVKLTVSDVASDSIGLKNANDSILKLNVLYNNKHDTLYIGSSITSDTLRIAIRTGISSTSQIVNAAKVYPNPASTILHIDLEKPGYYTAKLSSVAGQSIVSPTTGTIDISTLANGVYILTIYDSNNKLISTNKVAIVK